MKKVVLSVLLMSLLAACASQETKTGAGVEDKSANAGAGTGAAAGSGVAGNELKDPNSILSKRSVYYDFDKSDVKAEYKPMVEAHAKYLTSHADAKVTVQGNTDERGSREYNVALGQRRADSVKKIMNVLGVKEQQIETVSLGEEKPKATGHDEASWQQNRRSDIVYKGE